MAIDRNHIPRIAIEAAGGIQLCSSPEYLSTSPHGLVFDSSGGLGEHSRS